MIGRRIDIRYAKALYLAAEPEQVLDFVYEDMKSVSVLYLESAEFRHFLNSPDIRAQKKTQILQTLFSGKFHPMTLSFFQLTLKKLRLTKVYGMAQAYIEIYELRHGMQTVQVTTALPLDSENEALLVAQLGVLWQKQIQIQSKVQPKILGGAIFESQHLYYDASLLTRVHKLRRPFEINIHRSQL